MKSAAMRKESYEQTYEVKPPMHDKMALWENSPELRESVRADLYEWGGAQRGGLPNLGYYRENPVSALASTKPPTLRYDPEKVDRINDTMTLWRLGADQADPDKRREVLRYIRVIKRYFIGQGVVESMAKAERITRQHFYRLLGGAMRQFWVLHY